MKSSLENCLESLKKTEISVPLHQAALKRGILASKKVKSFSLPMNFFKLLPVTGLALVFVLSVAFVRPGERPTLIVPQNEVIDDIQHTSVHSSVIGGGIPVYSGLADAIVIGTVQKVGGGMAMLIPDQVLKGDKQADSFEIQVQDPDSNTWIEDVGSLEAGEKVLLFLGTDVNHRFVIFAGDAGKYTIDALNNVTSVDGSVIVLNEVIAQIEAAM